MLCGLEPDDNIKRQREFSLYLSKMVILLPKAWAELIAKCNSLLIIPAEVIDCPGHCHYIVHTCHRR